MKNKLVSGLILFSGSVFILAPIPLGLVALFNFSASFIDLFKNLVFTQEAHLYYGVIYLSYAAVSLGTLTPLGVGFLSWHQKLSQ